MRLDRLIAELVPDLTAVGVDGAARDLRILAAYVLGVPRDRVSLHMDMVLPPEQEAALRTLAQARQAGRPVSRLIGERAFWGRVFQIKDAVLDPRPETETLVHAALQVPAQRVLDLGTGSGAIAITLAAEWPETEVTATDICDKALQVAQTNAVRLGVAQRMTFLQSDWYAGIAGSFDLIISNPPYIAQKEMADLSREVVKFDPRLALTDEADGLSAYRQIIRGAEAHLQSDGRLMVEIGWQQGDAVRCLFEDYGFEGVEILKDMDDRDRVICGKRG